MGLPAYLGFNHRMTAIEILINYERSYALAGQLRVATIERPDDLLSLVFIHR